MALLAEELVQEWLNRKGYFTIRGLKLGVQEIDLLAIKPNGSTVECRHIEVTVSHNPISGIATLTREHQRATGRSGNSAKEKTPIELRAAVKAWFEKKYTMKRKADLKHALCPCEWTNELVVHKCKFSQEIEEMKRQGVRVIEFKDVLRELCDPKPNGFSAAGGDFALLISQNS